MVAPIDARVAFDADGETITLTLNMRTLALAKQGGVDLLNPAQPGAGPDDAEQSLDVFQSAALIAAFAAPSHPDFTADHGFALMVRHAKVCADALSELMAKFMGAVSPGDGVPHPPRPRRSPRKTPASTS